MDSNIIDFKGFLSMDAHRFLGRRRAIILFLFFLFALYFIQSGIAQYQTNLKERDHFQEFEKFKVDNFQFYGQYGTYGFRLLYTPGPLSAIFSNAGIITTNLNAFIDSGERMKIHEPFKGKNAFISYTSVFLNITGFILLFGSLLVLFCGLEAYRDKEFLRFLDSTMNRNKIFWFIFSSRLLLLSGSCLLTFLTVWFLYKLNGIGGVDVVKLSIYFLVAFLMLVFFLLSGMVAGSFKKRMVGMVTVFSVWLLFIFLLPAAVGKIVYSRAEEMISTSEIEKAKFSELMNFEKKAKKQMGKLDIENSNTETRQQLFNYFWNNGFKKIMGHEQTIINEMKNVISLHYDLSLIFPTSFFLSVNNEISGRGYENLITFYEHVYRLKMGFVKYYAEKSFFSNEKTVKPYLKGKENIFYAPSLLPGNFGFGLVISVFWLLLLILFSWFFFNRLFDQQPDAEKDKERELRTDDLKRGKVSIVFTSNPWRKFQLILKLKAEKIASVCIPGPDGLPDDIKLKTIFSSFTLQIPEKLQPVADKYCDGLYQGRS
jgi:hypothetical protein